MKNNEINGNTISGNFKGINLSNWSGESVDIKVNRGDFKMYDYKFSLDAGEQSYFESGKPCTAWMTLLMDGGIQTTLHLDGEPNPADWVSAAVAYIANLIA